MEPTQRGNGRNPLAAEPQENVFPVREPARALAMGRWRPLLVGLKKNSSASFTGNMYVCFLLGFPETHKWL